MGLDDQVHAGQGGRKVGAQQIVFGPLDVDQHQAAAILEGLEAVGFETLADDDAVGDPVLGG